MTEIKKLGTNYVDNSKFRVPGTEWQEDQGVLEIEGALGYHPSQLCVVEIGDGGKNSE